MLVQIDESSFVFAGDSSVHSTSSLNHLLQAILIGHTLGAEELSRNVDSFAAHNDNLLSTEKLLGDDTGKTSEKMAFPINDNLQLKKSASARADQTIVPMIESVAKDDHVLASLGVNLQPDRTKTWCR